MCWSPAPWPVLRIAVRRDYEQVQQVWNPDELIFLPGLILLRSCWTSCITRMWKLPNNSWGNMWVLKSAVKECECFIRTCDDDVFDEQEVLRCFWSVCRCQSFTHRSQWVSCQAASASFFSHLKRVGESRRVWSSARANSSSVPESQTSDSSRLSQQKSY